MLELLLGFLYLLMFDSFGQFKFVSKTLEDGIEFHLFLKKLLFEICLRCGGRFSEGSLGTFAAFVLANGVLPVFKIVLIWG